MKHDLEIMRAIIENIISHDYVLQYVPRVLVIFGKQKETFKTCLDILDLFSISGILENYES